MTLFDLFLRSLGLLSLLSAAGVVLSRNAVYSALSLTANLMIMAVLFLTLSLQFIGIAQLTIYAGAIMVVFLFAVTVLAPEEELRLTLSEGTRLSGVLVGLAIGASLAALMSNAVTGGAEAAAPPPGTVQQFAAQLFGQYVLPFEGTAFVLLVALIGAVLLGHRRLRG